MRASIEIQGAKELEQNLKTLGSRIHKKVVRKAVREGQRPLLTVAKINARSMVGGQMGVEIARNLQIRAPKKQRAGSYALVVKLRKGIENFVHKTKSGKHYYILAAIEYGHMVGKTFVSAIPFARNAAESTRSESIRRFTQEMRVGTLREAIKGRSG